jgi:hypothetical protein
MLQEAMRVEDMGLPALIVTFIKEDIPKNRESQVRLGNILKRTILPPILVDALGSKFTNWQNFLQAEFEKTDESTDSEEEITNLIDRSTKLFQFLYSDVEKGRRYQMNQDYAGVNYIESSMKAIDLKVVKSMRKSLTKNLKKFGWDLSAPRKMSLFLDEILIRYYDNFIRDDHKGSQLVAFLNEHPNNHEDVADMTWLDASNFAAKYFIEKEDEDMIIKRYPKKNMFWYNIGKGACSLEAGRMGHCGRETETGNSILYSLRRKNPKMKVSDSHVTISYVEDEAAVYQIKGKGNCHPEERYGPYVVDFLEMMEVEQVYETGQHSDCDFEEFIDYLQEKYPDAEYKGSERMRLNALDDEISNGDYNTEHVQIYSNFDDYDADPYLTINANVGFKVQIAFLSSDGEDAAAVRKRFLETFEQDEEEIKEEILEIVDFDYLDSYDQMGSFEISYFETDDFVTVSFDISDSDTGGYASTREEAESMIDTLLYSYEGGDVERYAEAIAEVITAKFGSLANPETAEKMQDILDRIDELDEGYNYFSVFDEDREIYFRTYGIELPIRVPQYPLPQGVNRQSNPDKYDEWENLSMAYQMALGSHRYDLKQDFTTAVKRFHKNAVNAASKQLSLAMAGMALPANLEAPSMIKWNEKIIIPKFVEIMIQSPKEEQIIGAKKLRNQKYVKPVYRIQITLMVEMSDDVSDIAWGMEYIDYLDKNMNNILSVFAESPEVQKIQSEINKVHADYVRRIKGGLDESRRRIKVKIT